MTELEWADVVTKLQGERDRLLDRLNVANERADKAEDERDALRASADELKRQYVEASRFAEAKSVETHALRAALERIVALRQPTDENMIAREALRGTERTADQPPAGPTK
jgi:uncharacterized coiled-coil DUF342 family protein